MILPNFTIPSRIDQNWAYSGIDSPDLCLDPKHFKSYPYSVSYQYNSRGYRDHEWPDDLQHAVWCIGDSFTVGLGSPVEHTWPRVLESTTGSRTINISMDGASNNWIARHAVNILNIVKPSVIIIHWSYLHRREGITHINSKAKSTFLNYYKNIKDPSWPDVTNVENFGSLPINIQNELLNFNDDAKWRKQINDEDLRLWHIRSEIHEDISNTLECINLVDYHRQDGRIIHSFIPEFVSGYQSNFYQQLKTDNPVIQELHRLDLARDGHHYDIKTSENFVRQIMQVLN
jgi:hypothetical protein